MTMPALPAFSTGIRDHYNRLKGRFASRDRTADLIHQVRQGNIRQLFPDELNFSISFNGSPIANFVDIVARDMAEGIAPLPSLACVSGKMQHQTDVERAEIKNRIGDHYWVKSKLEMQMLSGADRYISYGFVPLFVEPQPKMQRPYIHVEDPRNAYYELDRYHAIKVYAQYWRKSVDDLAAEFPEFGSMIRTDPTTGKKVENGDTEIEMVRWVDDTYVTFFLPSREGMVLTRYAHKCSRAPAWIAERPGEDDSPRGQFDDVIWVQVARSIMSTLALEAASIAVQSPIAVPADMDQLNIGPHAIMQSENARDIHKVNLDLPPQIFAEGQVLDQELRVGARYPEARSGQAGASVITGKGVEALLGSFDSQIKGAQMVFREALQQITSICFEMDEAWWPNVSKTVSGTLSGASYEFVYQPAKAINGRHDCTVTYGFAAGLAPSQSIITMLQLEGAGLIAKGTTMENLPFGVDQVQEMRKINVEGSREALKQGVFGLVQASGQMAAQGQDPMPIINLAVQMIQGLENGQTVEDAVAAAYSAMQAAQQQAAQQAQAAAQAAQEQAGPPGADAAGGGDGGGDPNAGLPPRGVAPGQAGLPPGGQPNVQSMISGFRGDGSTPVMQNEIKRTVPIGTQ